VIEVRYRTSWRRIIGPAYTYSALVLAVHDGDTFTAEVDLGFQVHVVTSVRLLGCNAIELADPGGVEAGEHLRGLLLGQGIYLRTVKPDKFGGRYDAQVTVTIAGVALDLATVLIEQGWAAPWDGKGPKRVPPWPRMVTP
jgi:endonuclease YncB( thermonuclease family)